MYSFKFSCIIGDEKGALMSCNKCGQCCRMIHMGDEAHRQIQGTKQSAEVRDLGFCHAHWKYLGQSCDIPGAFVVPGIILHVYACDLIGENNLCSIQETKPGLCTGYPHYDNGPLEEGPWPYPGCSYEKDVYIIALKKLLLSRISQLTPVPQLKIDESADETKELEKNAS